MPSYRIESRIYARYILKNLPDAKIAVLYENDDFGKDYLIAIYSLALLLAFLTCSKIPLRL
jgi:hypothetical protein